ncbi:MAG: ABC transporter ATP-binding protein [Planctomycetes bacterium]|nr:ABC transporter ATP-binding protein [Planctomycetota bacterium]
MTQPQAILFSSQPATVQPAVLAADLTRIFGSPPSVVHALNHLNLSVPAGKFICVVGPSGSGKTTLLNLVAGLDRPTGGTVMIDQADLAIFDDDHLARLRRTKIGYVQQAARLANRETARRNVMLPLLLGGADEESARRRADEALARVGLTDLADRKPPELSGGQVQLLAVARAIVIAPSILLLDEPTSNLDLDSSLQMALLIDEIRSQAGLTVLCATHDARLMELADSIAWLKDGSLERFADRRSVNIRSDSVSTR